MNELDGENHRRDQEEGEEGPQHQVEPEQRSGSHDRRTNDIATTVTSLTMRKTQTPRVTMTRQARIGRVIPLPTAHPPRSPVGVATGRGYSAQSA